MIQIHIDEQPVEGKRLGRHVNHDERSRLYAFSAPKANVIVTTTHARISPVLDQGSLGSCTGNALVGALGTAPDFAALPTNHPTLDESLAVKVYSAATKVDSASGEYPPTDTGSDGLSVAKVAKSLGLISGYLHTFTLNDALNALMTQPVIIGVNWYAGFDNPDTTGLVRVSGAVRGGHEFELIGVDAEAKTVTAVNSWGTGWGVNGCFSFSWDDLDRLLSEQGDVIMLIPLTAPAPSADVDPVFAKVLITWLNSSPWLYKKIRVAAQVWLKAKGFV